MVQDVEHSLAGSSSRLEHLVQPMQTGHGLIKERQIKDETDQFTKRDGSGQHLPPAHP
jgi:hypothetical protein